MLSDAILKMLRQRMELNPDDKSKDNEFNSLTKNEVFEAVLLWEGFIGYDKKIKRWVKNIYGVDLDKL